MLYYRGNLRKDLPFSVDELVSILLLNGVWIFSTLFYLRFGNHR